ncbi:hypothetical protein AB4Z54_71965, partial [Streptomyces sp. MCAF7]
DQDQEKLKELHRAYEKLVAADPDQAEVLKEVRMAAITLGFAKTDVRHIEEGFQDKYLGRTLPKTLNTVAVEEEAVAVPGLGVSVPGASAPVSAARALNDQILRAKAAALSTDPGVPDSEKSTAQILFDDAH